MITTRTILEVEAFSQLDYIGEAITALREAGELTHDRLRATLTAIHEHCEAAKQACGAIDELERRERQATTGALS